jgi:hypothetical protein
MLYIIFFYLHNYKTFYKKKILLIYNKNISIISFYFLITKNLPLHVGHSDFF